MKTKKKFFFSAILVSSLLVALEISSAVTLFFLNLDGEPRNVFQDNNYVYHPLRDHSHKPSDSVGGTTLRTDQSGYIVTPGAPPKPTLTVVLTGSSSARSSQPDEGERFTLAAQLQEVLKTEHELSVRVVNVAVGGYHAFQEAMTFYEYFEQFDNEADLVVSANGLYSIVNFMRRFPRHFQQKKIYDLYNQKQMHEINALMEGSALGILSSAGRFLQNLELSAVRLFERVMKWIAARHKKSQVEGIEESIFLNESYLEDSAFKALYLRLLNRESDLYHFMFRVAESRSMPFYLFLLPSRYTWKQAPANSFASKGRPFKRPEILRPIIEKFYLDLSSKEKSYDVINLMSSFDNISPNSPPFHEDQLHHYNGLGMNVLAGKIANAISGDLKRLANAKLSALRTVE